MRVERISACTVSFCPAKSDPDFHQCWCGRKEIEHHHVESRGMGGSKLKKHVVALCHNHHKAVTLHECYDIVTEFDWGKTYSYMDTNGEILHTRTLEAGSAAAVGDDARVGRRAGSISAAAPPASAKSSAGEAGNQWGSGPTGQEPSTGVEATDKRLAPNKAFGDDERPGGDNAGCPSREVLAVIGDSSPAEPFNLDSWCAEGMQLVYMGLAFRDATDGLRFAIGDWYNRGDRTLGEETPGYLRGFEDVTVRQYSWVAGCVAPDTRVSKLPWTYHRAVAALPPAEQGKWLQKAKDENLTTGELHRAIHGERPKIKRWSLEELRAAWAEWPALNRQFEIFLDYLEAK